ncbi:unnamed protein product [Bursaphelenchus xylophilus]|uniref:(pine wood nematode) hypothetical protein n=1 Tax=Bursaphelenchus xylophilus TaxID=6326 RepID=A0A1I7SLX4_BURXY|nr:unnamed protein product [Bursaphelenchus xylophilus]CAG9129904.1 unnamed protein product [Bursaphelenchus xylophilus]
MVPVASSVAEGNVSNGGVKRKSDAPVPCTTDRMTTRSGLALGSRIPPPKKSRPTVARRTFCPSVNMNIAEVAATSSSSANLSLRSEGLSSMGSSINSRLSGFNLGSEINGQDRCPHAELIPLPHTFLGEQVSRASSSGVSPFLNHANDPVNVLVNLEGAELAEALAAQRQWEIRRAQIEQDERLARQLWNAESVLNEPVIIVNPSPVTTKKVPNCQNSPAIVPASSFRESCSICFAEPALAPLRCKFCSQCVGCKSCVKQWFGGPSSEKNRKQCPLCRHNWKTLGPSYVTPIITG